MHARDLRLLLYFVQIAQAGSIRGAAAALSVSPPVVSQALRDLEDLIGQTLIRRTTRRLDLTEAGRIVQAEAEAMARHAGAAMNVGAAGRKVSGHLRLTAPVELAEAWLPPILAEYRARWPDVTLSVRAEDQAVDLGSAEADLAVRATPLDTTEEAETLTPAPYATLPLELICVPSLLKSGGDLETRLAHAGYLQAEDRVMPELRATRADGSEVRCPAPLTATASDRRTLHAMALQGLGAVLLIRDTVAEDLRAGRLVSLAPDLDFGVVAIRLLPVDPQPAPPVLAFLRLMEDQRVASNDGKSP